MIRNAVKFTDLNSFLDHIDRKGWNGEVTGLLFEDGRRPYCSAYFIPTDKLPQGFDLDDIDDFGGTFAKVKEFTYVGTERFVVDFMVFPQSLCGYVEVDSDSSITFADDTSTNDGSDMNFVINLQDVAGQEYYLAADGKMINLASTETDEPLLLKTNKQVTKQIANLREKYPQTCRITAVERRDFEDRRKIVQHPDDAV